MSGIQSPAPEPYIDARKLAAAMGVSPTTIKRWVAEGVPSETWGMSRTRRFLLSEVIEWARARSSGTVNDDDQPGRRMTTASPAT